MTRLQDMLIRDGCRDSKRMDLTVTVVRPKRRSLWSWANVLLRCYRHRPLSIEFVTFYNGCLGTGFQTSLEASKAQGVSLLPPTYLLHLCSTITCTVRHFVHQTHCPNLFAVTFFCVRPSDICCPLVCCHEGWFPHLFRTPCAVGSSPCFVNRCGSVFSWFSPSHVRLN